MSGYTLESFAGFSNRSRTLEQRKSPIFSEESSISCDKAASTNSDENIQDLDLLCKRLNEYNSQNEVAWALLRQQQRSVSSKQAHDVAAAARFRLRLDQTGPDGVAEPVSPTTRSRTEYPQRLRRSFSTENMSSVTGTRSTKTKDSQTNVRRRKLIRPPPLRLDSLNVAPQEVQSAALPVRNSSRRAMQDYFLNNEQIPLQRRATIASTERKAQRSNDQFPPRTASKSARTTPTIPVPPPTAALLPVDKSPSLPSSPTEDQLRREIELSLVEGRDRIQSEQGRSRKPAQMLSAEVRNELTRTATITATTTKASTTPTKPITTQLPTATPPSPPPPTVITPTTPAASDSWTATPAMTPATTATSEPTSSRRTPSPPAIEDISEPSPTDTSAASSKSSLRRKKSFFGWLQKKSEVDELIELYMSAEQLEEEPPKRRPSRPKLGIFRSKSSGQIAVSEEL